MTENLSAAISAQILAARTAAGTTRDELAAAARTAGAPAAFTAAALRNLESGRRSVAVDEALWLATGLGVPVRSLLGEHAHLFGADVREATPQSGPVEEATRTAIEALGELTGRQMVLAETAYALAEDLDGAGEKRQPPALARALAETVNALWELQPPEESGDDGLGAE